MHSDLSLRLALPADLAAVDALLARSYPQLLAGDYAPSVMVMAMPIIARARPELLASGRYYLVEDVAGNVLGAGGYSLDAPAARGAEPGAITPRLAHIRHVVTDPGAVRRGIGRAIIDRVARDAGREGVTRFDCLSTLTACPFYAALGFSPVASVTVPLRPGIDFPAIRMQRDL